MPQVTSLNELSAIRAWITAAERYQQSTVLTYQTIVKELTSSLAVDAFSACLRNRSPANAIELLERGRGVFWSQPTRLSSSLEDVIGSGAIGNTLAAKFIRLMSLILHAIDLSGPDQHDQVCGLAVGLQGVITEIRQLLSLSRFLLPSLFSDLQQAAGDGPVIQLRHTYRVR